MLLAVVLAVALVRRVCGFVATLAVSGGETGILPVLAVVRAWYRPRAWAHESRFGCWHLFLGDMLVVGVVEMAAMSSIVRLMLSVGACCLAIWCFCAAFFK